MKIITEASQLRECIKQLQKENRSIGFVPTMGNLHNGHLSLVHAAKMRCDRVVTSIYVNPTQFGPSEDFDQYPRTESSDAELLKSAKNDILFLPSTTEIYPNGQPGYVSLSLPKISQMLCGKNRPTHFSGVALVVTKLLNIINPDMAFFGEKDYQQLLLVKQLTKELAFHTQVIGVPIMREPNGLAMSSRNQYLSDNEKQTASALYQLLYNTSEKLRQQNLVVGTPELENHLTNSLTILVERGFKPEYFEIRHQHNLSVPRPDDKALILLIAAKIGNTRLIDNLTINL